MPRYYTFMCQQCSKTVTRPGIKPPRFCSQNCYHLARLNVIAQRIGEPIEQALRRLYVDERKSYRKIHKETGMNTRTIISCMREFGIPVRDRSEAVATQWENNPERRIEQGERFKEMRKGCFGPKHPNWKGGPIGGKHNMLGWEAYAETIRQRDNCRCTRCGVSNSESLRLHNKSLCVHHVVPYKLSRDNSPGNLRSLCIPCHMTVEPEFIWLL